MHPEPADNPGPHELLEQARAGDDQALGRLLQRYRNYLKVLVRLRLDSRLQAKVDSSDLIQESFIKACRNFAQFRGNTEAELLGWLRQILAHTLANVVRHYRSRRRDHRLENRLAEDLNESSEELGGLLAGEDSFPSHQAERHEQVVRLADALESLPEHYREVLLLRHLKELSFPEIARQMERSVGSVEKLWVRALARLREFLGEAP